MSSRSEAVVYGLNAALALARHRPQALLRVFHHKDVRKQVAPLLKAAAAERRPYREVEAHELEKLAQTTHHEGVVVVAAPLPLIDLPTLLSRWQAGGLYVALDEIGNPHNLGAILRTAAYFGAAGLIVPESARQATLSAAAVRVAQGGAEVVPVCGVPDLAAALQRLAERGVAAVAADTRGGVPLAGFVWPAAVCVVMGNEAVGLRPEIRARCTHRLTIAGGGEVESLNVSVAAGILIAAAAGRAR